MRFRGPITKFVSRAEWGAEPPKGPGKPLSKPYHHILFSFTHTDQCHTEEECIAILKQFQKDCMEKKGYDDIQFNFLLGGDDGIVFEGRGFDVSSPKPERFSSIDGRSFDVAYIGTYHDPKNTMPPLSQLRASSDLLMRAAEDGYIGPDNAEVISMRDISVENKPPKNEEQDKLQQLILDKAKKSKGKSNKQQQQV